MCHLIFFNRNSYWNSLNRTQIVTQVINRVTASSLEESGIKRTAIQEQWLLPVPELQGDGCTGGTRANFSNEINFFSLTWAL